MREAKPALCRLCPAYCPIVVTLEDGRAVEVVGDPDAPLKALIFDSWYDAYRGVVLICRVKEGTLRAGQKILLMHSDEDLNLNQIPAVLERSHETARRRLGVAMARHHQRLGGGRK